MDTCSFAEQVEVWETEKSRQQFYHQTTGFGSMSQRMMKAPNVFFFGDETYEELDMAAEWTIHVLGIEMKEDGDSEHSESLKRTFEAQEQQFAGLLGRYNFVVRQEETVLNNLYKGSGSGNAYIGLIGSESRGEQGSRNDFRGETYPVELHKHESRPYPNCTPVDVPVDIADLTKRQPWEYGVLEYDVSDYFDTAYPMSLSFRPMSTLGLAEDFLPESEHKPNAQSETGNEYTMCILSLSIEISYSTENGTTGDDELRKYAGLQEGARGLRELNVLRTTGSQYKSRIVKFLCGKSYVLFTFVRP